MVVAAVATLEVAATQVVVVAVIPEAEAVTLEAEVVQVDSKLSKAKVLQ